MTDLSATGPSAHDFSADGGCGCGAVRFRLTAAPLFVNCCHCSRCQRGSGAAFAVNAVIETSQVTLLSGDLEASLLPTESGSSQEVMRCSSCKTAVWSHYQRGGNKLAFVRVGTMDDPGALPPNIHIHTASKQSWLTLPSDVPVMPAFYELADHWPAESMARLAKVMAASG
ncbi:MAG: GFA family protein [Alphaproteobacteria bacterium]|jgi:hypothetical protein